MNISGHAAVHAKVAVNQFTEENKSTVIYKN